MLKAFDYQMQDVIFFFICYAAFCSSSRIILRRFSMPASPPPRTPFCFLICRRRGSRHYLQRLLLPMRGSGHGRHCRPPAAYCQRPLHICMPSRRSASSRGLKAEYWPRAAFSDAHCLRFSVWRRKQLLDAGRRRKKPPPRESTAEEAPRREFKRYKRALGQNTI